MSNIYKNMSSGGGLPPNIPTSFVTDVNSPSVPLANVENVVGGFVSTNNTKGVQTDGSSGSNTLTVQLTNRANVTSTTSDGAGQSQTVLLITPSNNSSATFRCLVVGYDSVDNASVGGEQLGLIKVAGGIVTIVGTNDTFDETDSAISSSDWNVVSTSPTLSITFTGVAGKTIVWRALFEYIQVP